MLSNPADHPMDVADPFHLRFRVKVTLDKGDGLWYADCLDLPGCHTFGETKEEALENIYEAIGDRILAGVDHAKEGVRERARSRAATWASRSSTETLEIVAA
jgi:hypothetical protein